MESISCLRRRKRMKKMMCVKGKPLARRGGVTQQSLYPVMNANMDGLGGSVDKSVLLCSL